LIKWTKVAAQIQTANALRESAIADKIAHLGTRSVRATQKCNPMNKVRRNTTQTLEEKKNMKAKSLSDT
jgi:hypothetical protein